VGHLFENGVGHFHENKVGIFLENIGLKVGHIPENSHMAWLTKYISLISHRYYSTAS
jgi:hypothetical protein